MHPPARPDRRRFLAGGLSLLGGVGLFGVPAGAAAARSRGTDDELPPTLVLLQLTGGNDGLSTVVPHAHDLYRRARKVTQIESERVLRLDDEIGLHPGLARLRERFERGQVALVRDVGYPEPSRSHFRSLDVWHAASARGRAAGRGWIGGLCEHLYGTEHDPNRVVQVGGRPLFALCSPDHPPASFTHPAGYRWVGQHDSMEGAAEREAAEGVPPALSHLRDVMRDAAESSQAIRDAVSRYRPRVVYPRHALGTSLSTVAALIQGRIGCRVLAVELGGFDTHADQRGKHDGLMEVLDACLAAFLEDLEGTPAAAGTVVLAYSEFGRRVWENASRGTDHGTAGPVFVIGPAVRGGVYGPGADLDALDGGDLVHGTDFRRVYAALVEGLFAADSSVVLGGRYEPLPLLRA